MLGKKINATFWHEFCNFPKSATLIVHNFLLLLKIWGWSKIKIWNLKKVLTNLFGLFWNVTSAFSASDLCAESVLSYNCLQRTSNWGTDWNKRYQILMYIICDAVVWVLEIKFEISIRKKPTQVIPTFSEEKPIFQVGKNVPVLGN